VGLLNKEQNDDPPIGGRTKMIVALSLAIYIVFNIKKIASEASQPIDDIKYFR
jgi:uncharacterized membrane protein YhiD involved in acid resistance